MPASRRVVAGCSILCLAVFAAAATIEPPPVPGAVDPAGFAAPDTSPLVHEGVINAPIAEVWKGISTAEGYKMWGVAQCDFDLRIGGKIRTHYDAKGTLGDEGTIEQEVLAYEPEHMLAFRVSKPPANFPFKEAWKSTWSVITLTDMGDGHTHMRLSGLGYTADAESQAMRKFFLSGNAWSIKKAQSHFDAAAKPPTGPAHAEHALADIVLETVLPCPRDAAWQLISTSEGWRRAMGLKSTIEVRPGGPFELYFRDGAAEGERGSEGCTVLSYLPEEMLSFTWNAPPEHAHARSLHTWVVIRLDDAGPMQTRLRLSHLGFEGHAKAHSGHEEEWKTVRKHFVEAWPRVLEAFRRTAALDRPSTERQP